MTKGKMENVNSAKDEEVNGQGKREKGVPRPHAGQTVASWL